MMVEKDGRIDETPKNKIPGDKVTIEQIKKAFQSFDYVYDSICNAIKSGNEKKAFELADQYIKSFEPIYNLIQKYNIKYDSQEIKIIIFNNLYGRSRIFQIRTCLLMDRDDISKEEKIQQLDDMYKKLNLWINGCALNKKDRLGMLAKLSIEYSTKRNKLEYEKNLEMIIKQLYNFLSFKL